MAALQVALKAVGLYGGAIDGIRGPGTRRAVKRFQRRHRLAADGVAGPVTRRALGRRGRPRLGSRAIRRGNRGWDVAALQFMLARRGHSPGSIDGGFGGGTIAAVRSFQRAAGLVADGVVGPATLRALHGARRGGSRGGGGTVGGPVVFFRPVQGPITDGFGKRWGRMHTGLDFPAATGTRVEAAGRGVVSFAGYNTGGYGYLVIVDHRLGYQTWYAHLSVETSYVGEPVVGGTRVGLVGSTGHSTGPHLHFGRCAATELRSTRCRACWPVPRAPRRDPRQEPPRRVPRGLPASADRLGVQDLPGSRRVRRPKGPRRARVCSG